jgi:lysophospholipase L1-like esterase
MKIQPNSRLIMIGDSVTDHGRAQPAGEGLFEAVGRGWGGYVAQVDALLSTTYPDYHIRVTNKGTSGNQVRDLAARWENDVVDLTPDWLSIMIGINDVWRQFDLPRQPEAWFLPEEYAATYEKLVRETRPRLKGLVLMTPYYIENNRQDAMRCRMDEYGAIVKEIAGKYDAIFIDTQAVFDGLLNHMHSAAIAWDRIHPNHIGYMALAKAFLNAIDFEWQR